MVPSAQEVPVGPGQPPHAPQGADRRRGRRVHRRGRDRRRVAGRCPRRGRMARHPLPDRRACCRRAARRVPRQLDRSRFDHLRRRRRPLPPSAPTRTRGDPVHSRRVRDGSKRRGRPCTGRSSSAHDPRVQLTTAYFVPDDDLIGDLCSAANRGVKVAILLPGPHADKRIVQVVAEPIHRRPE